MTEKDAVKCGSLGLEDAWAVPVDADLPPAFYATIERALRGIAADAAPARAKHV
jgi:tetraacyldisaccharide 4'-kinase